MKNVLIVGSGKKAVSYTNNKELNENIIGYIKDVEQSEMPVLGNIDDLEDVCNRYDIDEIKLALTKKSSSLIRDILLNLNNNRIPVSIIDDVTDKPRKVNPDDILENSAIFYEDTEVKDIYKDKIVLVTGGAGSIGSEIVKQLILLGTKKVIIYDLSEYLSFKIDQFLRDQNISHNKYKIIIGNILNAKKLNGVFRNEKPEIVFHAAAYKHVYLMEENVDEAILNNLQGIKNVVNMSVKHKVNNVVFISTDKVVNPKSIMGATKRLSELYIKKYSETDTVFNIVRFGNVVNSNGSIVEIFKNQILNKIPLTITDMNVKRFFLTITHAAKLVISCLKFHEKNKIFILNMGEQILIHDLALSLIRSYNLIPYKDIDIKCIGLKKGEKIAEKLFTADEEKSLMIKDADIFQMDNNGDDHNIEEIFSDLINAANNGLSNDELRKKLEEIFPSLSL